MMRVWIEGESSVVEEVEGVKWGLRLSVDILRGCDEMRREGSWW